MFFLLCTLSVDSPILTGLTPSFPTRRSSDLLHIVGTCIVLTMVAVLLVLFMLPVTRNLQAREAYLARLRQQAAEEEHIVRMGLLASGAAQDRKSTRLNSSH